MPDALKHTIPNDEILTRSGLLHHRSLTVALRSPATV